MCGSRTLLRRLSSAGALVLTERCGYVQGCGEVVAGLSGGRFSTVIRSQMGDIMAPLLELEPYLRGRVTGLEGQRLAERMESIIEHVIVDGAALVSARYGTCLGTPGPQRTFQLVSQCRVCRRWVPSLPLCVTPQCDDLLHSVKNGSARLRFDSFMQCASQLVSHVLPPCGSSIVLMRVECADQICGLHPRACTQANMLLGVSLRGKSWSW